MGGVLTEIILKSLQRALGLPLPLICN